MFGWPLATLAAKCTSDWPRGSEDSSPGLEEDQRREAGLRPHRLWAHGLHRPSIAEYLATSYRGDDSPSWAIAGRATDKLQKCVPTCAHRTICLWLRRNPRARPLRSMCERQPVIITAVGLISSRPDSWRHCRGHGQRPMLICALSCGLDAAHDRRPSRRAKRTVAPHRLLLRLRFNRSISASSRLPEKAREEIRTPGAAGQRPACASEMAPMFWRHRGERSGDVWPPPRATRP